MDVACQHSFHVAPHRHVMFTRYRKAPIWKYEKYCHESNRTDGHGMRITWCLQLIYIATSKDFLGCSGQSRVCVTTQRMSVILQPIGRWNNIFCFLCYEIAETEGYIGLNKLQIRARPWGRNELTCTSVALAQRFRWLEGHELDVYGFIFNRYYISSE